MIDDGRTSRDVSLGESVKEGNRTGGNCATPSLISTFLLRDPIPGLMETPLTGHQ